MPSVSTPATPLPHLRLEHFCGAFVRDKTPPGENGSMGFLAWFKGSEGNVLDLSQYKRAG